MLYFKRNWDEKRSDKYESWGTSVWYLEVNEDGMPVRQMEVYQNGKILKYDSSNCADKYGGLANQEIDLAEFKPYQITETEFEIQWEAKSSDKNKWNVIGWIKAIFVFVGSFPYLFITSENSPDFISPSYIFITVLFISLGLPIGMFINNKITGKVFNKAGWNLNPFKKVNYLSFIQVASIGLIAGGGSMLVGAFIKYQIFNMFGLFMLCWGVSLFVGMQLTMRFVLKP